MKKSDSTKALVKQLKRSFKSHIDSPPAWAWPFVPSIPFVGDAYEPGKCMLIYASAENLNWMNKKAGVPDRFTSSAAWDRYRQVYEDVGRDSDAFFPDVGIQPFTDGGLPYAGLFVASKMGLPTNELPRDFIKTIAFTNWAKFSIKTDKRNVDYISKQPKLNASLPLVLTELSILQPGVVLIPQAVWSLDFYAAAMQGITPDTKFLPIPQFNATVVNVHLQKYATLAKELRGGPPVESLGQWMENLSGFNVGNAWRFIGLLESQVCPRAYKCL
jgi:hypothetical protein